MTQGMKLPGLPTVESWVGAQTLYDAVRDGRNVIYVARIWRLVMAIF
jgi:hypothetical protein